jgi:hypothetical protein
VTSNPILKRLLGESAGVPPGPPPAEQAQEPEDPPRTQQPPAPELRDQGVDIAAPNIGELLQLWQSGDHMAVAARLMYTEASYADFVDLCFNIGHEQARELGQLLDELADTEGMEPPNTPPEYKDVLQRVATADTEEDVI